MGVARGSEIVVLGIQRPSDGAINDLPAAQVSVHVAPRPTLTEVSATSRQLAAVQVATQSWERKE